MTVFMKLCRHPLKKCSSPWRFPPGAPGRAIMRPLCISKSNAERRKQARPELNRVVTNHFALKFFRLAIIIWNICVVHGATRARRSCTLRARTLCLLCAVLRMGVHHDRSPKNYIQKKKWLWYFLVTIICRGCAWLPQCYHAYPQLSMGRQRVKNKSDRYEPNHEKNRDDVRFLVTRAAAFYEFHYTRAALLVFFVMITQKKRSM